MTIINSKFQTYCKTCFYTIFKNERIVYDGKPHHINCIEALRDDFPRFILPAHKEVFGAVNRNKLATLLELKGYSNKNDTKNYNHHANPGATLVG